MYTHTHAHAHTHTHVYGDRNWAKVPAVAVQTVGLVPSAAA